MITLTVIYCSNYNFDTIKYFETGKELNAFIKHKKRTFPGTVLRGHTLYIND